MSEPTEQQDIRELAEKEFSFLSDADRDNFFTLLDLMGNQVVDAGAGKVNYRSQFYHAVSDKLRSEEHPEGQYKSGFIGGSVHVADRSVNYQVTIDKNNKINCNIQSKEKSFS